MVSEAKNISRTLCYNNIITSGQKNHSGKQRNENYAISPKKIKKREGKKSFSLFIKTFNKLLDFWQFIFLYNFLFL